MVLTVVALLTGCGGPDLSGGPNAGLSCVDDSATCVNRRQTTLNHLTNDKNRAWIKQQPPPEAYASGVRLFALKNKKKELSCDELTHGRREADNAAKVLRGPGGANLTPAQVSRGLMLASEVSRELGREMKRRCKKT